MIVCCVDFTRLCHPFPLRDWFARLRLRYVTFAGRLPRLFYCLRLRFALLPFCRLVGLRLIATILLRLRLRLPFGYVYVTFTLRVTLPVYTLRILLPRTHTRLDRLRFVCWCCTTRYTRSFNTTTPAFTPVTFVAFVAFTLHTALRTLRYVCSTGLFCPFADIPVIDCRLLPVTVTRLVWTRSLHRFRLHFGLVHVLHAVCTRFILRSHAHRYFGLDLVRGLPRLVPIHTTRVLRSFTVHHTLPHLRLVVAFVFTLPRIRSTLFADFTFCGYVHLPTAVICRIRGSPHAPVYCRLPPRSLRSLRYVRTHCVTLRYWLRSRLRLPRYRVLRLIYVPRFDYVYALPRSYVTFTVPPRLRLLDVTHVVLVCCRTVVLRSTTLVTRLRL